MGHVMLCLAIALLAAVSSIPDLVSGHGRLLEPPSRASMWRVGFNTPPNYDDNQLFCGGASVQWQTNGGKCGICGDPWQGPREHEAGGKYATGTISRYYTQGQTIDVDVQITAHHKGYFEFRLCPHNDPTTPATHECLNQHILHLADGSGTRFTLPLGSWAGHFNVKLHLPANVVCSQCVFQWKYNTGNSWGTNPDGTGCVGCGPQEQFYGCADVAITPGSSNGAGTSSSPADPISTAESITTESTAVTATSASTPSPSTTATAVTTTASTPAPSPPLINDFSFLKQCKSAF